jgi:hypothetical protein
MSEIRRVEGSGEVRDQVRSCQKISGVMRNRGFGETTMNPERKRVRKSQGRD